MSSISEQVAAVVPGTIKPLNTAGGKPVVKGKSTGFIATAKVADGGKVYQLSAQAWLVKSKETGKVPTASITDVAEQLGKLAGLLSPKELGAAKKPGYFAQGKLLIGSDKFQGQITATPL